jgi:hypothetical protein
MYGTRHNILNIVYSIFLCYFCIGIDISLTANTRMNIPEMPPARKELTITVIHSEASRQLMEAIRRQLQNAPPVRIPDGLRITGFAPCTTVSPARR